MVNKIWCVNNNSGKTTSCRCLSNTLSLVLFWGLCTYDMQTYLSAAEFKEKFGMTKDAFYKLPKWKQSKLKMALQLFWSVPPHSFISLFLPFTPHPGILWSRTCKCVSFTSLWQYLHVSSIFYWKTWLNVSCSWEIQHQWGLFGASFGCFCSRVQKSFSSICRVQESFCSFYSYSRTLFWSAFSTHRNFRSFPILKNIWSREFDPLPTRPEGPVLRWDYCSVRTDMKPHTQGRKETYGNNLCGIFYYVFVLHVPFSCARLNISGGPLELLDLFLPSPSSLQDLSIQSLNVCRFESSLSRTWSLPIFTHLTSWERNAQITSSPQI